MDLFGRSGGRWEILGEAGCGRLGGWAPSRARKKSRRYQQGEVAVAIHMCTQHPHHRSHMSYRVVYHHISGGGEWNESSRFFRSALRYIATHSLPLPDSKRKIHISVIGFRQKITRQDSPTGDARPTSG